MQIDGLRQITQPAVTLKSVAGLPNNWTLPDVGRIKFNNNSMVVVLPAPFGPRNPNVSPSLTSSVSPFKALVCGPLTQKLEYSFPNFSAEIAAIIYFRISLLIFCSSLSSFG